MKPNDINFESCIKQYISTMKNFYWKHEKNLMTNQFKNIFKLSNLMVSLRQLIMFNLFIMLFRLNDVLKKTEFDILMNNMQLFRQKGLIVLKIFPLVQRKKDRDIQTSFQLLEFFIFDASKIRYVFQKICQYVLPITKHSKNGKSKTRKLFITKDIPMNSFYLKCVCNMVYIETRILHAGLSDQEKMQLVQQFNDPNYSLWVLIIQYQISAQRINLNVCCFRIIVLTPAVNSSSKTQTFVCVIQISGFSVKQICFVLI